MRSKSPRNSRRMVHFCAFVSTPPFFFFKWCLFLATLGLRWWAGFSLGLARGGYSPVAMGRLLIAEASLAVEPRL